MSKLESEKITKSSTQKIGIIIAAFNEENTITRVIKELVQNIDAQIIVVNDGSLDNTQKNVESIKNHTKNIHLINHPINIGPAMTIQTGVKFAKTIGCNYFIQVDGDGQHPPNEIKKLLKTLFDEKADVVIGSRYLKNTNYKTSPTRSIGIKTTSKIVSLFTNKKISDVSSGFRAFNIKYANKILEEYSSIDTLFEFTLRICRHGFIIKEIPIEMKQREHGSSYLSIPRLFAYPFRISYSIIRALI